MEVKFIVIDDLEFMRLFWKYDDCSYCMRLRKKPNNLKKNTSVAVQQKQKFRVEVATKGEMI